MQYNREDTIVRFIIIVICNFLTHLLRYDLFFGHHVRVDYRGAQRKGHILLS